MFFRHRIGEAIAEIERGRVHASSPARISLADPPRCSRRHRHDIEIKPVQDVRHLGPDPSPGGNDQHFGQRARRNQDLILGLERGDASLRPRLVEGNSHQRRGV